ncbi:MAG: kynureninase [Actinomycetes bacterium]|jgi:kynureninase|nr:kynureninase [Acidimicrobiia bacterium]
MLDRAYFEDLDSSDPLADLRNAFSLPDGLIYLDGNSLGPLPSHVPAVVQRTVVDEWGHDLIRSWNDHGWWDLAERVAERIAPLIGAPPGSVAVGDTTTVAVYKAVAAARRLRPDRRYILTDTGNFPTDLYVLHAVADQAGAEVMSVPPDQVLDRISPDVAVVSLTHVDYRTGRRHSIPDVDAAARDAGALVVWDLSHSVGAMDVDMSGSDFAVGCGYKYLNGGPGAPAFIYVHPSHQAGFRNPITGWWGHAEPFAMESAYRPAPGASRAQTGTQSILALVALDAALDVFDGVDTRALRVKSERLVADFIRLVDERLPWFEVVTPRAPDQRGSHVSLAHPEAGRIMAASIQRRVVGDVRPPNLLRFGLAPAYQRHVEVWDAVEAIRGVMESDAWRHAPERTGPVT